MQHRNIFCFLCLFFFNCFSTEEVWFVKFPQKENYLLIIEKSFPFIDLLEYDYLQSSYIFVLRDQDRTDFARFISKVDGFYRIFSKEIFNRKSSQKFKRWIASENPLDPTYYQHYLSYDQQQNWYNLLENSLLTKKFVRLHTIGHSYENRSLDVIELHTRRFRRRRRKHAVFIDGGMHAREWLSIGVANFVLIQFLTQKNTNLKVQEIFRHFDIFILPLMNPDGYEYSRTVNRLWRKNRAPTSHSEFWNGDEGCVGIDLNRNFPYQWNSTIGSINHPCTHSYGGPTPASEPEVLHVVNFLRRMKYPYPKIHAYFNLHAYGRFWLLPWTYSLNKKISNYDDLFQRSDQIAKDAMNQSYKVGQASHLLYPCSGTSIDFAATLMPHAMTFELSPVFSFLPMCTENNKMADESCTIGFLTGPEAIEIDGTEIFNAIVEYLYSVIEDFFE